MATKYKAQDYQYSQKTDVQDYLDSFDIQNNNIDFDNLANYEESDYVLNAAVLERIVTDTNSMQNEFHAEVDETLTDDADMFQFWINNLADNIKTWQSGSSYKYYKNEIVKTSPDNGAIYLCLQDCTGNEPLPPKFNPNNGYWIKNNTITQNMVKLGTKESIISTTINDVKANIDLVQDLSNGLPSPTNIRPISGWDKIEIIRAGKNLNIYPYNQTTITHNGITYTDNGDGTITANGTAIGDSVFNLHVRQQDGTGELMLPNNTYTLSGCPSNGSDSTYYIKVFKTYNNITEELGRDVGDGVVLKLKNDSSYNKINIQLSINIKDGATVNNLIFKPMIEIGSNVTEYESYNGNIYTINLDNICYGGNFDATTGELIINYKYIDLDTLNWNQSIMDDDTLWTSEEISDIYIPEDGGEPTRAISDYYSPYSFTDLYFNTSLIGLAVSQLGKFVIRTIDNNMPSAGSVAYPLRTPLTIQLTPIEISALSGVNNIWSNSGNTIVKYDEYCSKSENEYWVRIDLQGKKSFDFNYCGRIVNNTVYQVNDVVWYDNNFSVKLFVCISDVTYDSTDPSNDTTHWTLLYELVRDSFQIFDTMPNPSYLSNPNKCSVFGVIREDGITIDVIDATKTTDINYPVYVDLKTDSKNIFYDTNIYLNTIINSMKSRYNL